MRLLLILCFIKLLKNLKRILETYIINNFSEAVSLNNISYEALLNKSISYCTIQI
ncbi:hypothetical protein CLOSBL3_12661 [Clostridiaceae bacterium BL-3]|nr:hypothetical protein CLOSBL3_12661 [Clostridiaceae bacterium BL-3]